MAQDQGRRPVREQSRRFRRRRRVGAARVRQVRPTRAPPRPPCASPRSSPVWKSKFYGAFVLYLRVDLHAIDATPARWRGDAAPRCRRASARPSPRNDLVKNCRTRRWLISTQIVEPWPRRSMSRTLWFGCLASRSLGYAVIQFLVNPLYRASSRRPGPWRTRPGPAVRRSKPTCARGRTFFFFAEWCARGVCRRRRARPGVAALQRGLTLIPQRARGPVACTGCDAVLLAPDSLAARTTRLGTEGVRRSRVAVVRH